MKELTHLEKRLLYSLFLMYEQYCAGLNGFEGHQSMTAGEDAEDVLSQFDLFTNGKLDEDKLIKLIGHEF